jgi:GNAT superfamily N-acetyltransferase
VIIDYTKELVILAVIGSDENELIVAVGQYGIDEASHTAEIAFAVRDDHHNRGIGSELLSYLTYLAKREGLLGFTAEVLVDNQPMLHVFETGGFDAKKDAILAVGMWVLVAGGYGYYGYTSATGELFDESYWWESLPSGMSDVRANHTAVLLYSGSVLLIGGGLLGASQEIFKHPVKELLYIQIDPALTELEAKYLPGYGELKKNSRLRIVHQDARIF